MGRLHRRNQDGIALITVILSTSVLLLLVMACSTYAIGSLHLSRHDQDWNASLAAAEAGVDDYLYRLHNDESFVNCAALARIAAS